TDTLRTRVDPAGAYRLAQRGDTGRGRRLTEHTTQPRDRAPGVQDLRVRNRAERTARLPHDLDRGLPRRRPADADRGRDRLGTIDRRAMHERRGALRLTADYDRQARNAPGIELATEAQSPSRDVAAVADRQCQDVGCVAERFDHLVCAGRLSLDAERVDGVNERDAVPLRR